MIKGIITFLTLIMLVGIIQTPVMAVVHYRDVSHTPIRTTYSCSIRKQKCIVRKISYMQRNRAYYQSECIGTNFEQGRFTKEVETDVRRKRFEYCRLVSSF